MFGWSKRHAARLAELEEDAVKTRRELLALRQECDDLRERVRKLAMRWGKEEQRAERGPLGGDVRTGAAAHVVDEGAPQPDPVSARLLARRSRRLSAVPARAEPALSEEG